MKKLILLFAIAFISIIAFSQKKQTTAIVNNDDSILFSKVKYRSIGPYRGGRSGAVTGDLDQKNTFYFGGTGGGVWKTIDGGSNWKNITDKYFACIIASPYSKTFTYISP